MDVFGATSAEDSITCTDVAMPDPMKLSPTAAFDIEAGQTQTILAAEIKPHNLRLVSGNAERLLAGFTKEVGGEPDISLTEIRSKSKP